MFLSVPHDEMQKICSWDDLYSVTTFIPWSWESVFSQGAKGRTHTHTHIHTVCTVIQYNIFLLKKKSKPKYELYFLSTRRMYFSIFYVTYTGYTQKNGAVSNVNKKFISHLTRAQHTSAAATLQVSHALITILQCVHPGSHDTHPHGNQIHPRLGVACPL